VLLSRQSEAKFTSTIPRTLCLGRSMNSISSGFSKYRRENLPAHGSGLRSERECHAGDTVLPYVRNGGVLGSLHLRVGEPERVGRVHHTSCAVPVGGELSNSKTLHFLTPRLSQLTFYTLVVLKRVPSQPARQCSLKRRKFRQQRLDVFDWTKCRVAASPSPAMSA
jgi:hypothetical protein